MLKSVWRRVITLMFMSAPTSFLANKDLYYVVTSTVEVGGRSAKAFNQRMITYIKKTSVPTGGYTIFESPTSVSRTRTTAALTTSTTVATTQSRTTGHQNETVTPTKQSSIPPTTFSLPTHTASTNSTEDGSFHPINTENPNETYKLLFVQMVQFCTLHLDSLPAQTGLRPLSLAQVQGTVLRVPPIVGANVHKMNVRW
jgi:hypothetical protein